MESTVVVIEAPGKIAVFQALIGEILDKPFKVVATRGRLYDMPEERPSADHEPSAHDLIPVHPAVFERLEREFSGCNTVLLMTDNDVEGEVIAHQVSTLIPEGVHAFRIRFNSLCKSTIEKAIESPDAINPGMVSSGLAKRIFDYTIGKSVSPEHLAQNFGVAIGSVISPLLNKMAEGNIPIGAVTKSVADSNGDQWTLRIPFYPGEADEMAMVSEYLCGISEASIHAIEESDLPDPAAPMTGPEALEKLSLATHSCVSDVEASLQRSYEKGELSYPRSDSYYLSAETTQQLKALADHFGIDGFDPEFLHEKAMQKSQVGGNRRSQDAHEAIHTIDYKIPMYSSMADLHLDDQVKALLARHMFRSGQKDRRITNRKGRIDASIKNEGLLRYLQPYLDRIVLEQRLSYRKGLNRVQHVDDVSKPMGIPIGKKVNDTTSLITYPNDVRILKGLDALGIGRPSTVAGHATSISSRFMDEQGKVNKKGHMVIMTTRQLVPNLLKKEPQEVVDFLINNIENKELDYEVRASKALSVMGIRIAKKDQGTASPEPDLPYGFNN